jgi:hypothetical protein
MALQLVQSTVRPIRQSRRQRHLLWLSITFLSLGVSALALLLMAGSGAIRLKVHVLGIGFELAAAGLGIWLAVLMLWWSRQRGRFDPFEFPIWFSLNVYVQVVLNVWLLQRDRLPYVPWLSDNYDRSMPLAVILFGVGLTALWLGYVWAFRRLGRDVQRLQPPAGAMRLSQVALIWFLCWATAVFSTLAGISGYLATGVGSSSNWLNYFSFVDIIRSAATVALVIHHFRHPSLPGWLWFSLVVVSEFGLSLVAGSKGFAMALVWLAMYIYYATGKLPKRWLALGFVTVVFLVPVVNNYRQSLQALNLGGGVGLGDRTQALGSVLTRTVVQPFSSLLQTTTETFERRQGYMLDTTASVMVLHPDKMPFVGMQMIEYFVPQLIPRVLWPSKPLERSSLYLITTTYGGAPSEYSFTEIGMAADSYRAGGWVFVVIWFFSLGVLAAWLYLQGPSSGSRAGTVFYVVMITQFLLYSGDVVHTLVRLFQFGPLIWAIIMFVMFVPRQQRQLSSE